MPFKQDLQQLMQQFGGPMNAMATVQGIAGVAMAVVYQDPEASAEERKDEVALIIVPKQAHMEDDVIQVAINALQAHLQTKQAQDAGGAAGGPNN